MNIVIFTGPTLSAEEGRAVLDARYLAPAAQGDVYRAARHRPQLIGIVDGLFERTPAIWHKEILWAMSNGVHVFGSASLGALRAAELAAFGMEGVGAVFDAFRSGRLEDDDEVAVAHEPAAPYRSSSEAMVDIRATVAAALAAKVIRPATGAALEAVAKATFYAQRTYPRLVRLAADRGLPGQELAGFLEWLPAGRVLRKRADALAMLAVIQDRIAAGLEPKQVGYTFERSAIWEAWRMAVEGSEA